MYFTHFHLPLTMRRSASLVFQDAVKRGSPHLETKAPPNGGGEAPTVRSGFFTFLTFE